jgi:hypothetical protein
MDGARGARGARALHAARRSRGGHLAATFFVRAEVSTLEESLLRRAHQEYLAFTETFSRLRADACIDATTTAVASEG